MFQVANRAGEWGLFDMQTIGRAGEVAFFGDGEEALDLTQVHRASPESGSHWRRRAQLERALWERLLREALEGGLTTNMLRRLRSGQADGCLRHRAWHCRTDALKSRDLYV